MSSVNMVKRRGAYAPFTNTGDIVVNGVAASNYIALPPVLQNLLSFKVQHWMQHVAYMPYRIFCGATGGCKQETYDESTGLSKAVVVLIPLLRWLEYHIEMVAMPNHWVLFNMAHLAAALLGYFAWKVSRKTLPRGESIGPIKTQQD